VPLRMPRKQKIALLSVLSLSVLVIIAAIVRMVLVSQSENSDDPTCITSLPNPE
jgi:rhodopsin domain-containing protein